MDSLAFLVQGGREGSLAAVLGATLGLVAQTRSVRGCDWRDGDQWLQGLCETLSSPVTGCAEGTHSDTSPPVVLPVNQALLR